VEALTEDLNFYKKEVQMLRSEKETLENVLTMKTSATPSFRDISG
jgi:hypothetical protein